MSTPEVAKDPRLVAGIDLARRMGAHQVDVRWSDDEEPTVWFVVAHIRTDADGLPKRSGEQLRNEVGAALTPADAAVRLCEQLGDGGTCRHCGRTSGVSDDWRREMPLPDDVCWFVFDPETGKFRRSCEHDVPTLGRNDRCFCGSGRKFKHCHGA